MNLITSASSEIYQQAFSPGLRRTAGSVTATDVLILVLIAVLIVYLLARTFQGQCRTVCHQVCPIDNGQENFDASEMCFITATNISYKDADGEIKIAALGTEHNSKKEFDGNNGLIKSVSGVNYLPTTTLNL